MLLGAAFLFIKFRFEWYHDYVDGIVPGVNWNYHGPYAPGVQLFFCFYFFMTGLHALHMVVGFGILTVLVIMTARNKFSPRILCTARNQRTLLALCRYRLDISLPAALLDRRAVPGELIAHV